jgi:hypothetical protein
MATLLISVEAKPKAISRNFKRKGALPLWFVIYSLGIDG